MGNHLGMIGGFVGAALRTRGIGRHPRLRSRARWGVERSQAWADCAGWLVGCNFTPSTASNQLELWQLDTFDPATIDRELGWAAALGMNSIRLFLHDLMWELEGDAFLDRIDRVLNLAAGHGISVMPVLFDGVWDPDPRPGEQRHPRPGVHNSTWVQGPGATVLADRSRWRSLRAYVEAVVGRFGDDDRVIAWDLFNEPDSPNPAWAGRDPAGKSALVADLLDQVWDWAAAVDPVQPLTVGVFLFPDRHPERASRVARIALERSDVISFHNYGKPDEFEGRIAELESKLAAAQVIDQPAQRDRPQPSPSLAGLGAIVAGAAPHRDEGVLQRRVDHVGIGAAVVQAHQQPACMPVVQRLERASVAACDRGQQLGVGAQRRGHRHQRGSSRTHAVDACRRACRPCRHRRQSARAPRIGKASCCRMPSGIGPGMP